MCWLCFCLTTSNDMWPLLNHFSGNNGLSMVYIYDVFLHERPVRKDKIVSVEVYSFFYLVCVGRMFKISKILTFLKPAVCLQNIDDFNLNSQ